LWVGAAGLANRTNQTDMHPCHVLFSGSVAKTYTVTTAMKLYESGGLDLDAVIAPLLPEVVAQSLPNASTATVRQLMNHSAGIPDHDDELLLDFYLETHNGTLPSAEEQLAYLYDNPPNFPAGSDVKYSSAHTVALALIINNLARMHHGELINRELFQALNLRDSYYKFEQGLPHPENLVAGYVTDNGSLKDYTSAAVNYANTSEGDAGIMATAHDYFQFLRGLIEGQIINEQTLALMLEDIPIFEHENFAIGFASGLFTTHLDGNLVKVGHSGGTQGGSVTRLLLSAGTKLYCLTHQRCA